jgi:hypothetical protein
VGQDLVRRTLSYLAYNRPLYRSISGCDIASIFSPKKHNHGQISVGDKSKSIPELSIPALKKSTSHLVVCGATQHDKDYWLFGDFLSL